MKPTVDVGQFLTPVNIGTMSQASKVVVFGWAQDLNNTMIALSIQGSSTAVRAIQAIMSQGKRLELHVNDRSWNTKSANTKGQSYRYFWNPIPRSSWVSLIAINEMVFTSSPDNAYTFIPVFGELESAASDKNVQAAFHNKMKEICLIPVIESWSPYLMDYGSRTYPRRFGELSDRGGYWLAKGFRLMFVSTERDVWEKAISNGLACGDISLFKEKERV